MTIKLSECGYPKRYLWVTLKHILTSLSDLVSDLASHRIILAPCPKCKKHERFTGLLECKGNLRTYLCVTCGSEIQVEMDLPEFG